MSPLLALLLTLSPARAGEIVVGASGGWDFPTDQFWTGPELAFYPDGEKKWGGLVRVHPAWGFADAYPFLSVEGGVVRGFEVEGAHAVRAGVVLGAQVIAESYPVPFQFATGTRNWGVVPSVEGLVEFEFYEDRPLVVGLRFGVAATSSNSLCDQPDQIDTCLTWPAGIAGGFYARGQVAKSLYLEGLVGPSPRLALGYAF
jgi:hypothetical protein